MSFKRLVTFLLLTSVLLAGVAPVLAQTGFDLLPVIEAYMPAIPQGFGGVGVDTLASELAENPPFLVDVREANELADNGFIEGAVNVPVRTLAQHLDLLPEDLSTPIVVYCAKGTRGAIGMVALQVLGYTNVRNLSGGFGAWADAGYDGRHRRAGRRAGHRRRDRPRTGRRRGQLPDQRPAPGLGPGQRG